MWIPERGNKNIDPKRERLADAYLLKTGPVKHICWECGKPVTDWQRVRSGRQRDWCTECKVKRKEHLKQLEYWRKASKRETLIDNTVKIFEQQALDVYEYREAFQVAIDSMDSGKSKFDSAPEMALVVELINNRVRVKTQVDCGGYRLDIVLPEHRAVVEVDGPTHRHLIDHDATRDILVHEKLGEGWEVVHVKVSRVKGELPTLYEWILDEHSRIAEVRQANGGLLPYSRRGKSEVNEVMNYVRKIKHLI